MSQQSSTLLSCFLFLFATSTFDLLARSFSKVIEDNIYYANFACEIYVIDPEWKYSFLIIKQNWKL